VPLDKPYIQHLKDSKGLETPYSAIRAGFVALALEKSRRATPFIAQARALKSAASQASSPAMLMSISEIQMALLTAAGVSEKAKEHMMQQDKEEAIRKLIESFLEPAGPDFVEELVYRFLLTRGDALGGAMRNLGGVLAERKLARAIIAALTLAHISYEWLHRDSNTWVSGEGDNADIELYLKGISWSDAGRTRTLLYNRNVPLISNNVDLSVLSCGHRQVETARTVADSYIAFGELKGGIDPAGADEHWKTANTALSRIREAYLSQHLSHCTFFVGAAIAKNMAEEIWKQLETGTLANAANLTNEAHIASLCRWICSL
jgi:type II restriction enzyme